MTVNLRIFFWSGTLVGCVKNPISLKKRVQPLSFKFVINILNEKQNRGQILIKKAKKIQLDSEKEQGYLKLSVHIIFQCHVQALWTWLTRLSNQKNAISGTMDTLFSRCWIWNLLPENGKGFLRDAWWPQNLLGDEWLYPNYPRDAEPNITTRCVICYFTSAWRVIYKTC